MQNKNYNWRGIIGYALYDWACSPVPTLHATFIFAVYFTTQVAPENGTAYWGYMTALASLSVAIVAPFLGGLADAKSIRKLMLLIFTLIGGLSTLLLWNILPNSSFMMQALIISFISIWALLRQNQCDMGGTNHIWGNDDVSWTVWFIFSGA